MMATRGKITVAMIYCADAGNGLSGAMDNEPWQKRAKRAGLTQKALAKILGVSENTVSLQLRGKWQSGTPRYVKTVIMAWESLPIDAKDRIIEEAENEDQKSER